MTRSTTPPDASTLQLTALTSAILAAAATVGGAFAVLAGPVDGNLSAVGPVSWGFFVGVAVVAVATVVLATARAPRRVVFRLVMLAALLLAAQLVLTGSALT